MNNPNSVKIERKSFTCEEELSTYNCKQCSFQTDLLLFLRAHKSFRNNKSDFSIKKYTCKKCDFTSCSVLVLELHKENCTALKREKVCNRIQDQKQCKCAQCLSYRESYKTEIIFDPIKDFKNGKCSRIALKNYLQDHNYANTATQKIDCFKCNECGYQTEKLYCFIRHQLVHAQRSLDKSDFCLFKTTPKKDVRRHTNSEDIWFLCQHCNYKAREMKILNIHNKVFHGIDVMPPQDSTRNSYACSQCLHKFASKRSLMNHMVRHHAAPLKVNWYKCKQCAYTTKSLSELRDHKVMSKMCDLGKK